MSVVKLLERRIACMKAELRGLTVQRPYDGYPPGWDSGSRCDHEAWCRVLPNFPFDGQMWSKARYSIGWIDGRPVAMLRGQGKVVDAPYPPEAETAEVVEWTPELVEQWREWRRRCREHSPVELD